MSEYIDSAQSAEVETNKSNPLEDKSYELLQKGKFFRTVQYRNTFPLICIRHYSSLVTY